MNKTKKLLWEKSAIAKLIINREGKSKKYDIFKLCIVYFLRLIVRMLYVFPLRENRIVFYSYVGKQYSCNPKAITEYLKEKYDDKFEIVWLFIEPSDFKYVKEKNVKIVKYFSFKRMYYQATAKVCIDNSGSYYWFPLRKGQLHVNTWHGGGCYKNVRNGEVNKSVFYQQLFDFKVRETTQIVSSSKYFSNHVIKEEFGYKGEIIECGMPRNDILFRNYGVIRSRILKYYQCPENGKMIILYAPTWREHKERRRIDLKQIEEAVKLRFDRDCTFLFRAHNTMAEYEMPENMIDVSEYPDMQDLLCACDILITDYSSSIWDFSFTYKPCFLYTPDLDKYTAERGFGKDIYSWGFPVCKTNEALAEAIVNFNEEDFRKKMEEHHKDLGSFETGNATQTFCEFLIKEMEK